jgi:hypothetical protein
MGKSKAQKSSREPVDPPSDDAEDEEICEDEAFNLTMNEVRKFFSSNLAKAVEVMMIPKKKKKKKGPCDG